MPPDSKEQVRDKMARAVSLFSGNDPYSAWGRWLITLLIEQTARGDEAEFRIEHDGCWIDVEEGKDKWICDIAYPNIDPKHFWTKADWLAAAKKDLGVE